VLSERQAAALKQAREELKEVRKEQEAARVLQAEMRADMTDLRTEVQQLHGQISQSDHTDQEALRDSDALEQSLAMQLSSLQQDLRFTESRVRRVEDYFGLKRPQRDAGGERPAAAPGPPAVARTPAPAERAQQRAAAGAPAAGSPAEDLAKSFTPEEAYDAAFRLYKAKDYEKARVAFGRFMELYPSSSLADNAIFWIGETYYQSGQYAQAILQYKKVMDRYPKGSKAPDALLKMGYALEKIGERDAAVAALAKLLKEYPDAPQTKWARGKIEQLTPAKTGAQKDRRNDTEQNSKGAASENKPPN